MGYFSNLQVKPLDPFGGQLQVASPPPTQPLTVASPVQQPMLNVQRPAMQPQLPMAQPQQPSMPSPSVNPGGGAYSSYKDINIKPIGNTNDLLHSLTHGAANLAKSTFNSVTKPIEQIPADATMAATNLVNKAIGRAPVTAQQVSQMPNSQIYSGVKYAGATGKNTQLASDVGQAGLMAAGEPIASAVQKGVTGAVGLVAPNAAARAINLAGLGLRQVSNPLVDNAIKYGTGALAGSALNSGFGALSATSAGAPAGQVGQAALQGAAVGAGLGLAAPALSDAISAGANYIHNNPLDERGSLGSPENLEQQPPKGSPPKVNLKPPTAEEQSLFNSAPPEGSYAWLKQQEAETAPMRQRNADAEREALELLKNGGSRDEAIAIYKQAAQVSSKMAKYKVGIAAKQANQALNVSKATDNPLLKDFQLPTPEPGKYNTITRNHNAVINSIKLAQDRVFKYEKKLTPNDKAQLDDYVQGVKDISQAEKPNVVQQAVDAWRQGADTVHALGENFGHTKHGEDFFPGYWNREDPQVKTMDALRAEQQMEEQYGTQVWQNMSPEDKSNAMAEHTNSPGMTDDANYGGFHNKAKTFKNNAEGVEAGYLKLFDNPFDAMRRYFEGAKLQLGNQSIIQGIRDAEPTPEGQRFAVNLPGDSLARVGKQGYKELKSLSLKPPANLATKALKGTTKSIVKTIVTNPLIHGGNQEFNSLFSAAWNVPGFKPANMVRAIRNQMEFTTNKAAYDRWKTDFYKNGGFSPTYGKDDFGFVAKILDRVGITPKAAEIPNTAMAQLEENIRVATYKMGRDQGMNPSEAITAVNHALGDEHLLGDTASTFGLFLHYLMTNVKILGRAGLSVTKGNFSPVIGLALGYAAWLGANKAWQTITGNPNASVRAPGVLGTATQIAKAPGQLRRGQVPSVITSHTNPLIRIGIEQATNRNLSKPVTGPNAANNNLGGANGRLLQVAKDALGPFQSVSSMTSGKTSPLDTALGMGLGLYNTQKKTVTSDQQAFFNAQNQARNDMSGPQDKRNLDAYNTYFARNKTSDGKTIQLSQEDSRNQWGGLASNPKVLGEIQKTQTAAKNHNPEWDLNGVGQVRAPDGSLVNVPKMVLYAAYKNLPQGDLQKLAIAQQNPWIQTTENAAALWSQQNIKSGNSIAAPGYIPFPAQSPGVQDKFNQMTQLSGIPGADRTPDQIAQLNNLFKDPDIIKALHDQQTYTDQVRLAEHLPAIQRPTQETPDVTAAWASYDQLPSGKGIHARSDWIKANPDMWGKMQQQSEDSSMYNIEKYGGEAYYGAKVPDSFLGSIYGVGNYDISKVKNANGTNTYSLLNFLNTNTGIGGSGIGSNGLPTVNANSPNGAGATGNGSRSSSSAKKFYSKHQKPIKIRKPHFTHLKRPRAPHHTYMKFSLKAPKVNLSAQGTQIKVKPQKVNLGAKPQK